MAYNFEQDPEYQELLARFTPRTPEAAIPTVAPQRRGVSMEAVQRALSSQPTEPADRTWGQAVGDTALSLGRAALGVPKAFTDLGQLVPGVNVVADPLSRGLGSAQESLAGMMSPEAQASRRVISAVR